MARDDAYDVGRLRWSRLEFRASKLLVTASSVIEIGTESSATARSEWLQPVRGKPLMPARSEVVRIELDSQLMGKTSELDLWIDPSTGAAFQRTQLEVGKKVRHHRHRSLRFADTGVLSATYRATDATVDKPFDQWALTENFETYPLNLPPRAAVSEPSALFYLLAVAQLDKPGEQATTHLFSKGQVLRVTLVVEERTEIRVDYVVSGATPGSEQRIEGRKEALRIRLDGRPLVDDESETDFEFLGLQGDVEVLLDPEGRFPLQISGDIKRAGRGRIRLQRAVFR
jgi:hypothetical protein